jgi:hypothetical protein
MEVRFPSSNVEMRFSKEEDMAIPAIMKIWYYYC